MTHPFGGELRTRALLSIQRALWGRVTPDLRAVVVSWPEGTIEVRFTYEGAVDEDLRELVSEAETEMFADFDPDVQIRFVIDVLEPVHFVKLGAGEWWAYRRFEADSES